MNNLLNRIPPEKRPLAIIGALLVLVVLWALFRPELLFVKKSVDEPLPGATSSIASSHIPTA